MLGFISPRVYYRIGPLHKLKFGAASRIKYAYTLLNKPSQLGMLSFAEIITCTISASLPITDTNTGVLRVHLLQRTLELVDNREA